MDCFQYYRLHIDQVSVSTVGPETYRMVWAIIWFTDLWDGPQPYTLHRDQVVVSSVGKDIYDMIHSHKNGMKVK